MCYPYRIPWGASCMNPVNIFWHQCLTWVKITFSYHFVVGYFSKTDSIIINSTLLEGKKMLTNNSDLKQTFIQYLFCKYLPCLQFLFFDKILDLIHSIHPSGWTFSLNVRVVWQVNKIIYKDFYYSTTFAYFVLRKRQKAY